MNRDDAIARADLPGMLESIGGARGLRRRGKQYPCPSVMHEQTGATPPASLDPSEKLWKCHSCDAGGTIIDAMVLSGMAHDVADALGRLGVDDRPDDRSDDDWAPEAEYVYTTAEGDPVFKVIRFPGKRFRQQRWTGEKYVWGLEGVARVLYRLPAVLAAKAANKPIFLCEGERDADAVAAEGFCGTTMPGGAGKWEDGYTEALSGALVFILADDDEPGRKHAADVFRRLAGKAFVHARLPAEGYKDIADQLRAGVPLSKTTLRKHAVHDELAAHVNGNGSRGALTAAVFASRKTHVDEVLGPLFCRGMRTVIGAQTGEGKSTWAMQAVRCLVEGKPFLDERWTPKRPGRALIVDLEQGEATVQIRLREAGLDESEAVDILWEPSGITLDKREEDRAMVRDILREGGYDLVVFDPLYQMHSGGGSDEEVAAAVANIIDGWAREFNVSLVIPMHARKPHPEAGKNFTKHDIAGVNTWLRNAEVVLGLQIWYTLESKLHFFKDRIGRGPTINTHWWLDFDRSTGFTRNHKEEHDRIKKRMLELLRRDEGVTKAELMELAEGNEHLVQSAISGKHRNGEHYRTRKWSAGDAIEGQEQLI